MEGHDNRHELYELIRVFFPNRGIEFVDEDKVFPDGLTIKSILMDRIDKNLAITRLCRGGDLIKESLVNIDDIHIEGYPTRKIIRNALKKSIYDCLIDEVEMDIPWGILTGIRPIKIVHEMMDRGLDEKEIEGILASEFRISRDKTQLMLDIASIQRRHIYPLDRDKYSFYIGIPFCPSRCSYCSFPAFGIGKDYDRVKNYVDTLVYEIQELKGIMEGKWLNTVYIGGGTPTSLRVEDLERIITTVKDTFKDDDIREFTVEAGRPDTLNDEMLGMLKSTGIDRISINPQTMNPRTLDRIGRYHDIKSTISSYQLAKDHGFDIINMDIIIGLPGESIQDVAHTLEEIESLDPDNLTVHTLALKRGSRLLNQGKDLSTSADDIRAMLELTEAKAADMKMFPYYLYRQKQILGNLENVGYSKLGKECIYNISMMEEKETVMGLGLGAVSKIYFPDEDRIERLPNFKDLGEYSRRIDELLLKKKNFIS